MTQKNIEHVSILFAFLLTITSAEPLRGTERSGDRVLGIGLLLDFLRNLASGGHGSRPPGSGYERYSTQ